MSQELEECQNYALFVVHSYNFWSFKNDNKPLLIHFF